MFRSLIALASLALFTTACGHKVNVSYVSPAEVGLPADVGTVMVINRSVAKNAGEIALDVSEGLATGEGYETDRDTSARALEGLVAILDQTDRYNVVEFKVNGKAVDSSIFDKKLDKNTVIKLCKKNNCDAIIALDSLDTDTFSSVTTTKKQDGSREHTGQTNSNVSANFRVYDGDTGRVIDHQRIVGQASAEETDDQIREVVEAASMGGVLQDELAVSTGVQYGTRIAPHEVMDQRSYYKTGHPLLREGKRLMKAGQLKRAKSVWRELMASGSDKDAAKARFNLALAAELEGNLDKAMAMATKADDGLRKRRTSKYLGTLQQRVILAKKLDRQMGAAMAAKNGPKAAKLNVKKGNKAKKKLAKR